MNNLLTIVVCILIIAAFNLEVKFNPFTVKFGDWYSFFGIFFMVVSLAFFSIHFKKKGYNEAIKDVNKYYDLIEKK